MTKLSEFDLGLGLGVFFLCQLVFLALICFSIAFLYCVITKKISQTLTDAYDLDYGVSMGVPEDRWKATEVVIALHWSYVPRWSDASVKTSNGAFYLKVYTAQKEHIAKWTLTKFGFNIDSFNREEDAVTRECADWMNREMANKCLVSLVNKGLLVRRTRAKYQKESSYDSTRATKSIEEKEDSDPQVMSVEGYDSAAKIRSSMRVDLNSVLYNVWVRLDKNTKLRIRARRSLRSSSMSDDDGADSEDEREKKTFEKLYNLTLVQGEQEITFGVEYDGAINVTLVEQHAGSLTISNGLKILEKHRHLSLFSSVPAKS